MTAEEFLFDLKEAPPGYAILYAEGVSSLRSNQAKKAALAAYYRGECELVQRRESGPHTDGTPGKLSYFAIKRRDVRPPRVPFYLRPMVDRILGVKRAEDEREVRTPQLNPTMNRQGTENA